MHQYSRWLLQDEDNLREALRYSAAMLGELRTSQLTPQKYFELYMQTFTELQHLEVCLINTLTQLQHVCGFWISDNVCLLCRCFSRRSIRKVASTLTCMSWYSMLATSCHACEFATASTVATVLRMSLDMMQKSQSRFPRPCMNSFAIQVPVVHSWKLLHPQQGNCCQRHPEGPCGVVQGCAASHQRSFPAQLSLPGQLQSSVTF